MLFWTSNKLNESILILEEYSTIDEKAQFFNNGDARINMNIEGIFDELKKFQEKGDGFIYRGSSEAKYKLYSSSQRIYMNQDLHLQVPSDSISEHYRGFISKLIDGCKSWNNGVVGKLLQASGIHMNNGLAYLSYMQHFGVPTPFLDFSFNPYISLFFAIDNLTYKPSNTEIDNYFSLYYTFKDNTAFQSWKYVFNKDLKSQDLSYETIDEKDMSIILPDEELYKIMNSANIINQEGLFFYNNHPWYPLERTYHEFVTFFKGERGQAKFDELLMTETVSGCYNIHKSLIPAIRKKLDEMGINKNFIYPDMNDFRSKVTKQGILESLTLKK